jgi:hypothetical protein
MSFKIAQIHSAMAFIVPECMLHTAIDEYLRYNLNYGYPQKHKKIQMQKKHIYNARLGGCGQWLYRLLLFRNGQWTLN